MTIGPALALAFGLFLLGVGIEGGLKAIAEALIEITKRERR